MPGDYVRAGVLVVVVVAAAAFAGVTTAATSGSIDASPDSPGETATHTASVVIDGSAVGSSWADFQVEYQATDVSNVDQNDVTKIGIDRGDDAPGDTIDVDVSDDLSSAGADNNGHTLDIGLGGNYPLQQNDELVVVYENAQNPDAGEYDVALHANYQSADETDTATLSIASDSTQTTSESTTTQSTTTEQTTTQSTTTQSTTTEQTTTQSTTTEPTTTTTTDSGGSDSGGSDTGDSGGSDDPATTTTTDSGSDETDETNHTEWANVTAEPDDANATATHTVSALVDNETAGDSWNALEVDYNGTGVDVSNVGQGDVTRIGIDRTGNTSNETLTVNVSDDLSSVDASNDGETLTVGLGGNYTLEAGDEVVVAYEDVQNPGAGNYSVPVDVNHQSSGGTANASLAVDATETTTTTQTSEATPTDEPTETATPTDAPDTTDDASPASSPGFGTVAAVVALAAAAALLVRR